MTSSTVTKRVIIAGGRDLPITEEVIQRTIKTLPITCTLICGGAKGADQLSVEINKRFPKLFPVEYYLPDWDKYGKGAGFRRNAEMGNTATHLLAFWDKRSKGTKHMIDYAKFKGVKVKVIKYRRNLK